MFYYKQQSYFSQIVSKKAKITILFFMKNPNTTILCWVLCIWFQYIQRIEHKFQKLRITRKQTIGDPNIH